MKNLGFQIKGLSLAQLARLAVASSRKTANGHAHVFICIADHFEPKRGGVPRHVQRARLNCWMRDYPRLAGSFHDSLGRPPQHTFFYAMDEYEEEHLDRLTELCQKGVAEVEIHLHHDNDTSENLRDTLLSCKETLHARHGLLSRNSAGEITYGFIHGNWALDNSRPDGRWCGVNDEITVLRETGCYADFTMPSAPSNTQTRTINSIYYAIDDTRKPKSHDCGIAASVAARPPENGLLMIQGPLMLNWHQRKWSILPKLENGSLHAGNAPNEIRRALWHKASVSVLGRPEWIFIKLHTHGAQEENAGMLLGESMYQFHSLLASFHQQMPEFTYYYVTAREMAALVHQAEDGAIVPQLSNLSRVDRIPSSGLCS